MFKIGTNDLVMNITKIVEGKINHIMGKIDGECLGGDFTLVCWGKSLNKMPVKVNRLFHRFILT